ncbi:HPr family phosphocarrier protein [candidate division KSB1 bacterium]|nr:HPr family phosphocarrier protein [candidate division KSB1 bacterium]NIR69500.1 HPr family phosphocarrier protein [candidate division KSB1 bacterium]NIS24268.1 HPr family phosphocarrier protein [candidate division KSB1 bacterium]NIT71183.1 HPr family phosphocarrier protein [candidate division KSB1 bacterium]NIU24887.1 HPr family phosphocarrier protein [candidate division KSB1 bacterium]
MIQKKVRIKNKLGLHARPAAQFVKTAAQFKSDVFLGRDDHEVNGKSIMGVMMLAAEMGSELTLSVDGEDEKEAMKELLGLINGKFDEE